MGTVSRTATGIHCEFVSIWIFFIAKCRNIRKAGGVPFTATKKLSMGFSRLSKRRPDELMGLENKKQKTERSDAMGKDNNSQSKRPSSSSDIVEERSALNNHQKVVELQCGNQTT